jgi:uncharacterized membrane protein YhaH (DUF805 family)
LGGQIMANSSRAGRIGRSQYWIALAVYLAAVVILVGASFYFLLTLNLAIAIAAFLIVAPLGIYFRVLMMRRCRDIGWPASLPWLIFAASVGASMFGGLGSLGASVGSPTGIKGLLIGGLGLPLLISLIDLGFTILIGCIRTKDMGENLAQLFGPGPNDPVPARPIAHGDEPWADAPRRDPVPSTPVHGESDYSSFDAAVARALEARRNPEPQLMTEPATAPAPAAHARVAGFGRKLV